MYFCLAPGIYAGRYENDIIILDSIRDKYLSITDVSAEVFVLLLKSEFQLIGDLYLPIDSLDEQYDSAFASSCIKELIIQGFFNEVTTLEKPNNLPSPRVQGGLSGYRWDTKNSAASFAPTPKRDIFNALVTLIRVQYLVKKGIGPVINSVKSFSKSADFVIPTEKEIQQLSDAVDIACSFYVKKVFCLSWAATFALLALKKRWKCNFVIGAQSYPFYAHAWVEIDDKVINDAQQVQDYLTILVKEPFGF